MQHSWHLFIVRIEEPVFGVDRDRFMEAIKQRGIGTGLHVRAVHQQKYYRERDYRSTGLAHTEWNSERICSLPLFPAMRDSDVDRVIEAIKAIRK